MPRPQTADYSGASLLFGNSLLSEYQLARDVFGFSDRRIAAVAEASIVHSTASRALKSGASAGIRQWLGHDEQ